MSFVTPTRSIDAISDLKPVIDSNMRLSVIHAFALPLQGLRQHVRT